MELRHLRYFVAVAEERHFTRAAYNLGIAQPALSQQIKQLEKELGFDLLHRTKRTVALTDAGVVFLQEAYRTLAQAERAVHAARRAHQGESGRLVIGFVGSASHKVLPEVLRLYRRHYPDVALELTELTSMQQVQALQNQEIDVGFVRSVEFDETVHYEPVSSERLVVALPEEHELALETQIAITSLEPEPFIIFPRRLGPNFYDQIIGLCQGASFSPKIAQEAVQMQTIVSLVAGGLGIALVPEAVQNLERTGVAYRPLEGPSPKVNLFLIWRREHRSAPLRSFVEVLREAVSR